MKLKEILMGSALALGMLNPLSTKPLEKSVPKTELPKQAYVEITNQRSIDHYKEFFTGKQGKCSPDPAKFQINEKGKEDPNLGRHFYLPFFEQDAEGERKTGELYILDPTKKELEQLISNNQDKNPDKNNEVKLITVPLFYFSKLVAPNSYNSGKNAKEHKRTLDKKMQQETLKDICSMGLILLKQLYPKYNTLAAATYIPKGTMAYAGTIKVIGNGKETYQDLFINKVNTAMFYLSNTHKSK